MPHFVKREKNQQDATNLMFIIQLVGFSLPTFTMHGHKSLKFATFCILTLELTSTSKFSTILQSATIYCDDLQIAVLMIRFEYKEQKLRSINTEMPFNICCFHFKNYTSQTVSLTSNTFMQL